MRTLITIWVFVMSVLPMLSFAGTDRDNVHWYSHQSGEWDDYNCWTTDPSGINWDNDWGQEDGYPKPGDDVTILPGISIVLLDEEREVNGEIQYIPKNGHVECKNLTVNGILVLSKQNEHKVYGTLDGNGRIVMAGDHFPACVTNNFKNEGTVVFNFDKPIILTRDVEYGNIEILGNTSITNVTLSTGLTINGDLTLVTAAKLVLNNTSDDNDKQTIDIKGDINVGEECRITIDEHSKPFDIKVKGNINNDGKIMFTLLDKPATAPQTEGYADVYFINANADQTIQCNDSTVFHRIIMDKGIDDHYKLTISAFKKENFCIFGYAQNATAEDQTYNNFILRKGTLFIGSNITIPFLNTGVFKIPANVSVVVDAGKVNTDPSKTNASFLVEGKLIVQHFGELNAYSENNGITISNGMFKISGGTVNTVTLKCGDAEGSIHGQYYQTGGTVNVTYTNVSYKFSIANSDCGFVIAGGTLNILNGCIEVLSGEGNYAVSNGIVNLDAGDGNNIIIKSCVPFPTLNLLRSKDKEDDAMVQVESPATSLNVVGSLSVGKKVKFQLNTIPVYIGANLTVEGKFECNDSHYTYFNGNGNSEISVPDDFKGFGNLNINKNDANAKVFALSNFKILNQLYVTKGKFLNDGHDIQVNRDITIGAGGNIESGSGDIVLYGNEHHTLTGPLFPAATFGNIFFKNGSGDMNLQGPIVVQKFKFGSHNRRVNLNGHYVEVTGELSGASSTQYFNNNKANSSSGGLKLHLTLTAGQTRTIKYHIGSNDQYTPAEITIDGSMITSDISGTICVNSVNSEHPNLITGDGHKNIGRYWAVVQSGFDDVAKGAATYTFTNHTNIDNIDDNLRPIGFWGMRGWLVSANTTISGSSFTFSRADCGIASSDYTCAKLGDYDIKVYRTWSGQKYDYDCATKNQTPHGNSKCRIRQAKFDNQEIWRLLNSDGNETNIKGVPGENDVAYVYYNRVYLDNLDGKDSLRVGQLIFMDTDEYYEPDDMEHQPRLQLKYPAHIKKVSGEGVIAQTISSSTPIVKIDDISDFAKEPNSWLIYLLSNDINNLDDYPEIPNLAIENGKFFTYTANKRINFSFKMTGDAKYRFPSNTSTGNLIVGKDLYIGDFNGGQLLFNATGDPHTLELGGDIKMDIRSGGTRQIAFNGKPNNNSPSLLEHRLILNGNIYMAENTAIKLSSNNGSKYAGVILELGGTDDTKLTVSGKPSTIPIPEFWKIVMNKTAGKSFTVEPSFKLQSATDQLANAAIKPLTLNSGHLIFKSAPADNQECVLASAGDFVIASDAELTVNGGTFKTTNGAGMKLSGKLNIINKSTWTIDGGVEYSESGNSTINIGNAEISEDNSSLTVGTQIRPTLTAGGSLKLSLNHANSVLTVGSSAANINPDQEHGVFELVNLSELYWAKSATINIKGRVDGGKVPDVYIAPSKSNVDSESILNIRNGSNTLPVTIFSSIELPNVDISEKSSLQMMSGDLTIKGKLNIGGAENAADGCQFSTGGFLLYLKGDMNLSNGGTFDHGNSTVYICGNNKQTISGDITFYNLVKNTKNEVEFTNNTFTVKNKAEFLAGTYSAYTIVAEGNVTNYAIFKYSGSGSGLEFIEVQNHEHEQTLLSNENGVLGKITINNSKGVVLPAGNTFRVTNNITFSNGNLKIGTNTITMDKGAKFINANNARRVEVTDAYASGGVRKIFAEDELGVYFIPVGTSKYTPISIDVTEINEGGDFKFRPINEPPSCLTPEQQESALNYFWINLSENLTKFKGTIKFTAKQADAKQKICTRVNYVSAIQPYSESLFDKQYRYRIGTSGTDTLIFAFTNVNGAKVSGKYIAGCDEAIPDNIQEYVSFDDGEFDDPIWHLVKSDGTVDENHAYSAPYNSIVHVKNNVTLSKNKTTIYKLFIEEGGVLDLNGKNHCDFGVIYGKGTLRMHLGSLPVGIFDDFISENGGTICFYGEEEAGSYTIMSSLSQANNIEIEGDESSTKSFPNHPVVILGNLTIKGNIENGFNSTIYLKGDLNYLRGNALFGTGTKAKFVFNGNTTQTVNGNTIDKGHKLFNIVIDNSDSVVLKTPVTVRHTLEFKQGKISTHNGLLTLASEQTDVVIGATNKCYVDGPLCKYIERGSSFTYPLGRSYGGHDYRGDFTVQDVEAGETSKWTAQYYYCDQPPMYWEQQYLHPSLRVSVHPHAYWSVYAGNAEENTATDFKARIATWWNQASKIFDPITEPNMRQVHLEYDPTLEHFWNITGDIPVVYDKDPTIGSVTSHNLIDITTSSTTPEYFTFGYDADFKFSWIGYHSSDWFNPHNWKSNSVPGRNVDVEIGKNGNGTSYDPIIDRTDVTAIAKSLKIQDGRSLTIASRAKLTVYGDVTVEDNASLVLKAANTLEDKDADGCYHSVPPSGSFIYGGLFSGQVTFQRYVRDYEWERICVPVTGYSASQLLNSARIRRYQEWANLDNDPVFYSYKQDENEDNNNDILADAWEIISSPHVNSIDSTYLYLYRRPGYGHALTFKGMPLANGSESHSVKVNFTRNDVFKKGEQETYGLDGWNFVANPFLSSIDASQLSFDNVDATIYVHDNINDYSFSYTINAGDPAGIIPNGQEYNPRYIAAGQAFFVHATPDAANFNGSVTFPYESRSHGSEKTVIKGSNNSSDGIEKIVFNTVSNGDKFQSIVYCNDEATMNFDSKYDAYLCETSEKNVLNFYSFGNSMDEALVVNGLPTSIKDGGEIQLGYSTQTAGTYTLAVKKLTVEGTNIYLQDTEKGTIVPLSAGFACQIDVEKGTNNHRFKLIFKPNNAPVVNRPIADLKVMPNQQFDYSLGTNLFVENDILHYVANVDVTLVGGNLLPSWLEYDYETGMLSGNPTYDDMGVYNIVITATDTHGAQSSVSFDIEVLNPANPQGALGDVTINSGKFILAISDGVYTGFLGETLIYTYTLDNDAPLPLFLSYNPTDGSLSCHTDESQKVTLVLTIRDLYGNSLTDRFTLNVELPTETPEPIQPNDPDVVQPTPEEPVIIEPTPTEPVIVEPTPAEPIIIEPIIEEPVVIVPEIIEPEVIGPEIVTPEIVTPEISNPEVNTSNDNTSEDTTSDDTITETTEPEVTQPEVTQPEVTNTEIPKPEVIMPDVVIPEIVLPEVETPEVIEHNEVEPDPVDSEDNEDYVSKIVPNIWPDENQNVIDDVNVYPVPSNGIFTVNLESLLYENGSVQLTIISVSGRVVVQRVVTDGKVEFDFTGRPGMYIIRLVTPSQIVTKRIVIK